MRNNHVLLGVVTIGMLALLGFIGYSLYNSIQADELQSLPAPPASFSDDIFQLQDPSGVNPPPSQSNNAPAPGSGSGQSSVDSSPGATTSPTPAPSQGSTSQVQINNSTGSSSQTTGGGSSTTNTTGSQSTTSDSTPNGKLSDEDLFNTNENGEVPLSNEETSWVTNFINSPRVEKANRLAEEFRQFIAQGVVAVVNGVANLYNRLAGS